MLTLLDTREDLPDATVCRDHWKVNMKKKRVKNCYREVESKQSERGSYEGRAADRQKLLNFLCPGFSGQWQKLGQD